MSNRISHETRRAEEAPRDAAGDEPNAPTPFPSARRGFPIGRVVVVALLVGFSVIVGARVRSAMQQRAEQAAERQKQADAAGKPQAAGGAATVAGVAQTWTPRVALEGTLMPAREADLGFKVGGRVAAIRARLGQKVAAGDVLATLEQTEAQAQAAAASAQVRAAEAQLALADDAAKRTTALIDSGSAPSASGVQVGQQRALAAAQLDGARAQLALADAALKSHTLAAPFSGTVTRVPSGPGAIVGPGVPLFHLQDNTTLKLSGSIGDADLPLVKIGAAVEVKAEDGAAKGRVVAVLSTVDAATRRIPLEAEVHNDGAQPLLAGAFVRATVVGAEPLAVLRLPATALRPGSQDEVMLVRDGRLETRRVAFAVAPDGALLVRHGLARGERVLSSPSAEARDGDPVAAEPRR